MPKAQHILCVDDNEDNLELLKIFFEQADYRVKTCSKVEDCLEEIENNEFSAIVMDYRMAGENTLPICREIKETNPHLPFVYFTGDVTEISRQAGLAAGADAYLIKPDDLERVVPTVSQLITAFG